MNTFYVFLKKMNTFYIFTMKTCCSIVVVFLLLFIACQTVYEEKKKFHSNNTYNHIAADHKGIIISSSGLTPLTTPARKSMQHLLIGCDQETHDL